MEAIIIAVVALAVVAAATVCALFVRPTVLFACAVGASVLSGNADRLGLPVSPDRVLLVAALASLLVGAYRLPRAQGQRVFRPVEVGMVVVVTIGVASAIAAGTLTQSEGFFGLLDRLGIVPFVGFLVADRLFGTDDDRRTLVTVLTIVGAYLSLTAMFEILGATALVFPRYINNPLIGSHWGRARGPFLEAGANGLALFVCGACAATGCRIFRSQWARAVGLLVAGMCAVGVLLTLTRADWIGAVAGALVGCALDPRARRRIVPAAIGAAVLIAVALLLVPGLSSRASERTAEQKPIWDRQNTDATAFRMVEHDPLFGIGWYRFATENSNWARQADGYPLSATYIGVHNVALSYAAELGLVGVIPWAVTVALGALAAWKGSKSLPPVWRALAAAIFVDWLIVSNFDPLAYAFPNLCLWLFLGIAAAPTARRLIPGTPQPALIEAV